MTLPEIIAAIQNKPLNANGSLTLTPADFGGDTFMSSWFTNVLQGETFTLASAKLTPDGGTLTVAGTAPIWDAGALSVSFVFSADTDGNAQIAVSAALDPSHTVTLQIIPWLQVTSITMNAVLTSDELVAFSYTCTLQAPGHPGVPVTVNRTTATSWRISIAENATQPVTADDLVALLDGNALSTFLPQVFLNVLDGITVNNLQGVFDTQANTVSFLHAGVTVTNGWNIAPGVSLHPGLQINLSLLQATDPVNREFAAMVAGTFLLGGTTVPVTIGASVGATTIWSFGIAPGQTVTLPAFTSLLQLAGADFYNSVPSSLRDLPAIDVNTLQVNFDSTNNVLTELTFNVSTASNWALLPGYFELNNFQVAFDITNVNVPASRAVTGSVYGVFRLGASLYLACTIAQDGTNPGWIVNAGLPPNATLNITQLATALFENKVAVPSNLPQLVFTAINASVTPSVGTFTLTADTSDPWTLFPKFIITGFQLSITRANSAGNPITGSVTTQLIVGATGINLSATLSNAPGAGWQFAGSLQQGQVLAIGDVITYLTTTFGMGAPPAWIAGMALQDFSVTFNTATANELYQFQVSGNVPLAGEDFQVIVSFEINGSAATGFTKTLSGTVVVNDTTFSLAFDSTTTDTRFSASWGANAPSGYLQLANLVAALGITLPGTDALDLSLKSATLVYDFTQSAFVLEIDSVSYGSAAFVSYLDSTSTRQYYFGLSVSAGVNLSNLPLVDKLLPSGDTLGISGITASITSTPVTSAAAIASLNVLLGANASLLPSQGVAEAVQFSMNFGFGSTTVPVSLAFGGGNSNVTAAPALMTVPRQKSLAAQAASDDIYWFTVQRNFGPLYVSRVGVQYKNNVISVPLDASLTMGGMEVDVMGLSVGLDIRNFSPQFGINGLGIDYSNGAVEIGGAFLHLDPPQSPATLEFAGGVIVRTQKFSVAAFGDYAQIPTGTSLFMFAAVSAPFGGPPFFFITGFCGGFGYNSSLRLPGIDEIYQFPFVAGLTNPSQVGGAGASPLQVIEVITGQTGQPAWVTPQAGEMWAAIGIQFSTFSIINSTALLAAVFGNDFKLALIGLSTASFPMGAPTPYAYIELELEALFDPTDGVISFSAVLSPNSYLIDPNCHLTGGFAMYFWYGNSPYAGDFVTTLGGYSHYFNPPSWYPQVPRLGFNWSLDSNISITGGAYFALTPSALMAGGSLVAMYQSGNLKAWFTAYADIVIWWNPFHFIADIGLTIGASYKLNLLFTSVTMTMEMGADLTLWGPPTGGTVTVHWYVISFTVNFGAGQSNGAQQQQWSDFHLVLPAATDAVKFTPVKGLTSAAESSSAQSSSKMLRSGMKGAALGDAPSSGPWLVRGDQFQFVTDAAIPVSDLFIGKTSTTAVQSGSLLNIRPMQQTGLSSSHRVYLELADGTEIDMLDPQSTWTWSVNVKNVPNALWGQGDCSALSDGSDQLVAGQYTGLVLTAPPASIGYSPGVVTLQNLEIDPLPPGVNPLLTGQAATGPAPVQSTTTLAQVAQISQSQPSRNGIASALLSLGITVTNDNPVNLGTNAGILFSDEPMLINSTTSTHPDEVNDPPPAPTPILTYGMNTDPEYVQVSVSGQDPSTAKITIVVSNTTGVPVTVSSIVFGFNVGNDSGDLTADATSILTSSISQPPPSPQWNIVSLGYGQYQATPIKPAYGTITGDGLSFVFYDINVNTVIGVTPVTITENSTAQSGTTTLYVNKYTPGFYVDNFQAQGSTTVKPGDTVTLTWTGTENATYLMTWDTFSQDVTNVRTFTSPSLTESTTNFYLIVTAVQGVNTITVKLLVSITVTQPKVDTFTASANPINVGDSVTLSWTTENADHCRLVPAMGTDKLLANGNTPVTPSLQNTLFNLYAYDAKELCVYQAKPAVSIQFNNGSIASFTATPSSIYAGGPVTLAWSLVSAWSPSINQGIGAVTGTSLVVNIPAAITYVLSCQGIQGNIVSSGVPISIISIAQFLVGRTYSIPYMDNETELLIFVDNTNAQLGFVGMDPSDYQPGTWTLTGNSLTFTMGDYYFYFTFDPPSNTFAENYNPATADADTFVLPTGMSPQAATKHKFKLAKAAMLGDSSSSGDVFSTPPPLLTYGLSTEPANVAVSIPGLDANIASVTVTVSNEGFVAVNCSSITFSLNVGKDAQDITADDSTIKWSSMPSGQWNVTALGSGQFQATPAKPEYGTIAGGGLSFQFTGINVNTEVGSTPFVITEVTTSKTTSVTATDTKQINKVYPVLTVANFIATPQIIGAGGTTQLTWSGSENATYQLSWGTQKPVDVSNVRAYNVTLQGPCTMNFYLKATSTDPTQLSPITNFFPVTVNPAQVISFSPSASPINYGDAVTLTWMTQYADHCTLSPAAGTSGLVANSSVSVVPSLTVNNFVLTAYDTNQYSSGASQPLTIAFNNAVIDSFSAGPQPTYPNGFVTLSWSTTSAISVSIDNGIGNVPLSGSIVAQVQGAMGIFMLSCQGVQGTVTQIITVHVIPLDQYLIGRTYTITPINSYEAWSLNNVVSFVLTFNDGSNATLVTNTQASLIGDDPQTDHCTWSLQDLNVSLGDGYVFTFAPWGNNFIYVDPYANEPIGGQPMGGGGNSGGGVDPIGGGGFGGGGGIDDSSKPEALEPSPKPESLEPSPKGTPDPGTKDADPSVLLDYAMTLTPDPVQASITGQSPNTATVTVVVSNGGMTQITCTGITFSFNVGPLAQDLTTDDSSMHTIVTSSANPPQNWTLTAQGYGQFLAAPKTSQDANITADGLSFSFYDINVNTEVGTTPLVIAETTSAQTATTTMQIGKFPPGFTAGNFIATPQQIAVGATTVATWSGSPAKYMLSWGGQAPVDVSKLNSYSIPGLLQNTTLYLAVTATQNGSTAQRILTFPVTVLPVKIDTFGPSATTINLGDAVTFSWTTENAAACVLSPPLGTGTLAANGNVSVVPTLDRFQFTLIAYSAGSLTFAQFPPVSIEFNPGVINSFTTNLAQTYVNGPFTLSWGITSALSPSISPGIGVVSGTSVQTTALQTTTFVLTCQTVSGPISQPVPVTIISVAQYLVGLTYSVGNRNGVYMALHPYTSPDDCPDEDAWLSDTLVFYSGNTATYSWTYNDTNADDESNIANGSQSYSGTWSIDGNNLVSLVTPQGTFTFQFNAANNTLTLQNPPALVLNCGTVPSGWVRYNCTFSLS